MKNLILILMIMIVFSGCSPILRPIIKVSEMERTCREIAIIIQKDGKGVSRKTPYSYSQTIEILREGFMPHYEFVVEKFGEKNCYGMCRVYNAGVFGKKIRLLVIEKLVIEKSENVRIWTWTGEIGVDGKISESEVSQIFANQISQFLMK